MEKFAGIAGDNDGIPELPDSIVQPAIDLNVVKHYFKRKIKEHYGNDRHLVAARYAHLTDPQQIHLEQGQSKCLHQTMCNRGCNLGGYFSSNTSTIPWAMKTGNLTMRHDSVVHSIIFDDEQEKVTGVRIIDRHSNVMMGYYANIVFVDASALNSNMILMNSKSNRFQDGLGNDNGLLGKYIVWHNHRENASASVPGFEDKKTEGRRPSYAYISRFRNIFEQESNLDFQRGYAVGVSAGREDYSDTDTIGDDLRENILNPELNDNWHIGTWMMGETVPLEKNNVCLSEDKPDKYGIPQLIVSCEWDENDNNMTEDYLQEMTAMFEKAGFINIEAEDTHSPPGADIYEMGGVRMGHDPKTSLTNKWNQMHHARNVFVTDGACMTSTGSQIPTLTFMAFDGSRCELCCGGDEEGEYLTSIID